MSTDTIENMNDTIGLESKVSEFPKFTGKALLRPQDYEQDVSGNPNVILDEYTVASYQYATSSRPNELKPNAIIYAENLEDVRLAIQYARNNGISMAIRSGGHQFWGFSSTSGENIQLDMSNFRKFEWNDDEERTFTAGVGMMLGKIDERLVERGAFVPHGQCGQVCIGGHLMTGGFSVLCGRSFGFFCDHVLEYQMITANLDTVTVTKPDPENPDPENDDIWFAMIGGSPGNFGVVTEMKIRPLYDIDYPESRCSTLYIPYSRSGHEKLLQLIAEFNDNDDLPADFNVCTFILDKWENPSPNIDTKMMNKHPEIYGGELHSHPCIIGVWGTWIDLTGDGYTEEVKSFFKLLEDRVDDAKSISDHLMLGFVRLLKLLKLKDSSDMPDFSPDEPIPMSQISKQFCFNDRVHANPYVSATWCGTSQETSTNGFAEWACEASSKIYKQKGCYADFEWVVCGGKYSRNILNAELNPTAVAWRDTTMLCFQYVHYDNTDSKGREWKEPGEYSRNWVTECQEQAVGENGFIGEADRRWNAFPNQDEDLDESRDMYFQNENVYERVLDLKKYLDPDNIFTPNKFCVGASSN